MSETAEITLRTVVIAGLATLLLAPVATGLGWWLARRRGVVVSVVSGLCLLPLVLPPVVTGWMLLRLIGANGPFAALFGALGVQLAFTPAAAVLAAAVVGLPLAVTAARQAFAEVDPRLEDVARVGGASAWRAFREVSLPLALPGLLAGFLLSFARAVGEFGATMVVAGDTDATRTLSIAVYAALDRPDGVLTVWWLSVVCATIGGGALLLAELARGRSRVR